MQDGCGKFHRTSEEHHSRVDMCTYVVCESPRRRVDQVRITIKYAETTHAQHVTRCRYVLVDLQIHLQIQIQLKDTVQFGPVQGGPFTLERRMKESLNIKFLGAKRVGGLVYMDPGVYSIYDKSIGLWANFMLAEALISTNCSCSYSTN